MGVVTDGYATFGSVAVIMFFIISGFLISASWWNRKNFFSFITARIKRIFPGLSIMLIVTVTSGAFITKVEFANYFSSALPYFFMNLILKGQVALADIFNTNPFGPAVNGSLWTLRFEFTCYVIVGLLGVLGKFNRTWIWIMWVLSLGLSMVNHMPTVFFSHLFPLVVWFMAGMLAYLYRDFIWKKI